MSFALPDLPYDESALDPHISERTIGFHYGKHHAGYVTNLNGLVEGTPHESSSLEDIIVAAEPGPMFNNAAQIWNHTFYWNSMSPGGGGDPTGDLATGIEAAFGSVDGFKTQFRTAAIGNFGSGWTWLVKAGGSLAIVSTDDADTPLNHGQTALLTIDVWEHAYYLDYQNARPAYVDTFIEQLVNWEFVAKNFAAA
jgi:Fe-Mn family superoxide dismutase